MRKIGNFFKKLSVLLSIVILPVFSFGIITSCMLPDNISTINNGNISIKTGGIPFSITPNSEEDVMVSNAASRKIYKAKAKMLGIIPVKTVNVSVAPAKYVEICGTPFGIKIFTDGVMVVGISDVSTEQGMVNPAKRAGLKTGDIIETVNGKKAKSNEQVAKTIEQGGNVEMTVKRGNKEKSVTVKPVRSNEDGLYKAGMWVRDSSAGIGTLTFIDRENKTFGGLGHAICDIDTGDIIPLSDGEIVPVTLTGLTKSTSGSPGELRGFLCDDISGKLKKNNNLGVYGSASDNLKGIKYEVAMQQEVVKGEAKMLTTLPGQKADFYDIYIEKVNYNEKSKTRNLVIRITDERILKECGGIVQGMSGSPIIQNNKFAGAVTHVFIDNPQLGYGIFAENMIDESAAIK